MIGRLACALTQGAPISSLIATGSQREVKSMLVMRIVAVTGYGQRSDQMATRAAGFDEHFIKPIDLKALTSALRR